MSHLQKTSTKKAKRKKKKCIENQNKKNEKREKCEIPKKYCVFRGGIMKVSDKKIYRNKNLKI